MINENYHHNALKQKHAAKVKRSGIVSSETFQRFTQFYSRVKDVRSRQKVQEVRSATKFDWIHLKTN